MVHPYHHALSSVRKWGGNVDDYQKIHDWFDESKAHYADFRHRALRHHSQGIFEAERVFGTTIKLSTGRIVPVRFIAEQHVLEDCGFIPSVADWLRCIQAEPWMFRVGRKIDDEGGGKPVSSNTPTDVSFAPVHSEVEVNHAG